MCNDVKWIKLVVDLFDDEKIQLIEAMPERYELITCWVKLLCMAGKQNNSGVFMLTKRKPYTEEMLATVFHMERDTVGNALEVFEDFGMVERVDGVITIPNWGKYQNLDTVERNRQQTRNRVANYRAKQKALAQSDVTPPVTDVTLPVTLPLRNVTVTEEEREEELEVEEDINNNSLFLSSENSAEKTAKPPARELSADWHEHMADRLESLGLMQGAALHREDAARLRRAAR